MPRTYIRLGVFAKTQVVLWETSSNKNVVHDGFVGHVLRTEDTFLSNKAFRDVMQLLTVEELQASAPGATLLEHRITSSAIAIGVFNRFSFDLVAKDPAKLSPRFGTISKIVAPASSVVTKADLQAKVPTISFLLDGAEYIIPPFSVKLVGGKKYK